MEKQETANEAIQGWQKILGNPSVIQEPKDLSSLIEELEAGNEEDDKTIKASEQSNNTSSDNKNDLSKEEKQDTKSVQDIYNIENTFDAMSIEDIEEETLPTYRR